MANIVAVNTAGSLLTVRAVSRRLETMGLDPQLFFIGVDGVDLNIRQFERNAFDDFDTPWLSVTQKV